MKRCAILSHAGLRLVPVQLVTALTFTFAVAVLVPLQMGQAQRSYEPAKVEKVSAQPYANGTVVSISADGSLNGAQTWQDSEGYHVVLPDTVPAESLKASRGLKVRRIGSSLEVVLLTKPGAKVSVQPNGNSLSLFTDSKLEARPIDVDPRGENNSFEERRLFEEPQQPMPRQNETSNLKLSSTVGDSASDLRPSTTDKPTSNVASVPTVTVPTSASEPANNGTAVPAGDSGISVDGENDGLLASIFSGTSVFVVFALGLFGLLVSRKLRSRHVAVASDESFSELAEEDSEVSSLQTRGPDAGNSLVRSGDLDSANGLSRQSVVRMPVAGPSSLYGAYRIDQEVGKLVLGQAHRIDVLSSRAVDDRRAIETSLIKIVNSPDLDENARRKAREALEEYGFVARQCASLLLAPDAFERTSAARSLGEIKSPAALPFLLEGLYDSESIVRNQAVVSIGELKLPSAIGALLDIARMHPDVPSALLSRTLSACSVEGLDFFDVTPETGLLGSGHDTSIIDEITHLEPAGAVEALPEDSDDERLAQALVSLQSADVEERSAVLKTLVQFRVESSVNAIAAIARHDSEPNVRSAAISSLGIINHESVFPSVLIGMSDESREVRAAAARSLNRLSFDRADAYVRVIETCDDDTIAEVAKACIKAGIVSQNLDRLASCDRRQAYETFSLICLLAKAKINEPVLHAIANHSDMDVRLKAIHLLACTGQPEIFEQVRELAVRDGIGEEVKTALLEAMYKLDQARLKEAEQLTAAVIESEFESAVESEFELEPEVENAVPAFEPLLVRELEPEFESDFEVDVQSKQEELEL